MEIAGFIVNSFVDYPAHIACVVFTPGCNMNCWYCHNRSIINETKGSYDEDKILQIIAERRSFLDGVVISGGEPTLQPDLANFMGKIKKLGLRVKLDTNGSNPEVLASLVNKQLVDYIAMDIKAPFEKYNKITIIPDIEKIKQSVKFIMECGVDYEFRTTFAPNLQVDDIVSICKSIEGAKQYSLQGYEVPEYLDKNKVPPHSRSTFNEAEYKSTKYVKKFVIKNL